MSASDLNAYRSCYCESCHQLRNDFGIVSTAAVNYDMTFNSIILNSLSDKGVEHQNTRNGMICILGKSIANNELLRKIAGYTIILTKWELEDDRRDHSGMRSNAARLALGRAIRKAERMYPEYDEQVGKGFDILTKMESNGCTDASYIGRTFSKMLLPAMKDIANGTWNDDLETFFTDLGAMIYVMDAVDDIDEDIVNSTFNPFLYGREDIVNKERFVNGNIYAITDMMHDIMKNVQTSYSSIRASMNFHHGIADNVIYHSIPDSAKRAMECGCSSGPSIKNAISSRLLRRNE